MYYQYTIINQIFIFIGISLFIKDALLSFWLNFFSSTYERYVLICCMTTITQKIKIKTMTNVGHHMFTKSVFYTPSLTEKTKVNLQYQLFWCWLVLIAVKILVMAKKKFKFDRLCWLSKWWTKMPLPSVFTHALGLCFVTSEYDTD